MAAPADARLKVAVFSVAAALVAAATLLAAWPSGIEPAAWQPAAVSMLPPSTPFPAAERIQPGLEGPAFVAIAPGGQLVAGLADARLQMFSATSVESKPLSLAPSRPFGIAWGLGQVAVVASGSAGLVAARKSRLMPLASEVDGRAVRYAADVAVSFARGDIYFTDASDRHDPAHSWAEFVERGARGRLIAFDSNRNASRVLAGGLHFPYGIALSADGSHILVCEMTRYRVLRHWLDGERRGTTEVFADGLPGYPADIAPDGQGGYWLSLYAPRIESLDRLAQWPRLRALWFKLPRMLQPQPGHAAWLLHLDASGRVTQNLRDDSDDAYAPISGVLAHEGFVYLGSPTQRGLLRFDARRMLETSGETP